MVPLYSVVKQTTITGTVAQPEEAASVTRLQRVNRHQRGFKPCSSHEGE